MRGTTQLGVSALLVASVLWAGCQGQIEQPDGLRVAPGEPAPLTFECNKKEEPPVAHLRRMSREQYSRTLDSLIALYLGGHHRDEMRAEIEFELESIPDDLVNDANGELVRGATFRRMNEDVTQVHVNAYIKVAKNFAAHAMSNLDRRAAFVGACSVDADVDNDAACIDDFIRDFGMMAMRRPISEDEFSFYKEVYADGGNDFEINADGFADVIAVLLASPDFLYHVEAQGESINGRDDMYEVGPYALASRLSYHFWRTMPDRELFEAAADGSLLTEAGYEAQVERVYSDPRTQDTLDAFFYEWLDLEHTANPNALVGTARYDAFAGDDAPGPQIRQAMIDEVLSLARHYRELADGTLDDVFLSDLSFARDPELARIYGVPAWSGDDNMPRFSDPQRSGVLTRAALIATGTVTTRPIHKGVVIRRNILCDSMPNPPANRPNNEALEPPYTKRAETEALTEQPGSSCVGCHTTINPLGFATEGFDALGRVRFSEPFYVADGSVMANMNLDTTAAPKVTANDNTVVSDGAALSEHIVESGKAHACFARHYFRYTFGRPEDLSKDGCALESLREKSINGGSLRDMLKSVAYEDVFKMRKRGED